MGTPATSFVKPPRSYALPAELVPSVEEMDLLLAEHEASEARTSVSKPVVVITVFSKQAELAKHEAEFAIKISHADWRKLPQILGKLPIDPENSTGYADAAKILKDALATLGDRDFEAAARDKAMITPIRTLTLAVCRDITTRLGFSPKMFKAMDGKIPSLIAYFQDHLGETEKLKLKKIIAVTEGRWPLLNLDPVLTDSVP